MTVSYPMFARGLGLLVLATALVACGDQNPPIVSPPVSPPDAPSSGDTRQIQLGGETVTVEVVGGLLLFEGDIEVGTVAELDAGRLEPQAFFYDQDYDHRWPGGVVPYVWDANVTTSDRAVLSDAMNLWMAAVPAVRFVPRSRQSDYLRFKRRDGVTDRCSSKPGRQGGEQLVSLMETGPCGKFGMVHELGHALGLMHEQSREDRDRHVIINLANVQAGREGNFSKRASEGLDVGAYDFDSIMHYGRFAFCRRDAQGNCVGPTITTIPAGTPIGQRSHLSSGDIAAMKWLYLRNWLVADGGRAAWRSFGSSGVKAADLAPGDFNGDGRTDFFRADASACVWYVAYSQLSGPVVAQAVGESVRQRLPVFGASYAGPWTVLSTGKCESLSSLRFGDFDGDRKTDVFVTSGGTWYLSKGGVDWWTELNTSSLPLSSLAFGDFDGDGKTDVFRGNGSSWYISSGGSGAWQVLNSSGYLVSSLGFADFNGDTRTDVFRTTGGRWLVSYGGAGPWTALNSSSYTLGSLRFGHFDGDTKADIYRPGGSGWRVSYGGSGLWRELPSWFKLAPYTSVSGFLFGDFDGNGSKDVFATLN